MSVPRQALTRALRRASAAALGGPLTGGNPRVGCAIVDDEGRVLALGYHRGAGTPHAEVDALAQVDASAVRGATAVVTLEPCNHVGRTGPCARAVAQAGRARGIFAVCDPNGPASGGARALGERGIRVETAAEAGIDAPAIEEAQELSRQWRRAVTRQRPWTIGKSAMSADGYVAAVDGTSQWITSRDSREHAHTVRAQVDAIIVGTGTVFADNPTLSARTPTGEDLPYQPRVYVVGLREIPSTYTLALSGATLLRTRDLEAVLARCYADGARRILLEGGPTLLGAALARNLVDEWHCYRAPTLLGEGTPACVGLGVHSLSEAVQLKSIEEAHLGPDTFTRYEIRT